MAEYLRLPGRGRPRGLRALLTGPSTLWMGGDHLLAVDSNGWRETYRRFDYRDIQAILITPRSIAPQAAALGLPPVALAGLGLAMGGTEGLFWAALGYVPLLLALLVQLARGPLCICRIQTAVQSGELHSLNRRWKADKALGSILPRIESAQGTIDPRSIPLMESAPATRAAAPRPVAELHGADRGDARPKATYRGGRHAVLFGLLLLEAPLVLAVAPGSLRILLETPVLLGIALAVLVSAARHRAPLATSLLRGSVWAAALLLAAKVYASVVAMAVLGPQPGPMPSFWGNPAHPLWLVIDRIFIGADVAVAVVGFLALAVARRGLQSEPAAAGGVAA